MSLPSIAALYLSVNAFSCAGVAATALRATENRSAPATVKIFEVFMAATVVGSISATQANSKKEKLLLTPAARAIPLCPSGAVASR